MKRAYSMGARAEATAARRDDILRAAQGLFLASSYDEVSLQAVADAAGVSLKTVMRAFGTKDALLVACAQARYEYEQRVVDPGDVRGAVRVLAERYEQTSVAMLRYLAVEARIPAVHAGLQHVRQGHLEWLAVVFAPWLPARGATRTRRLATLFGATEQYVWWSWRQHLGFSRALAESAMVETLEALVAQWRS